MMDDILSERARDGSPSADLPRRAIILAGGKGRRLYPFTATIPKPLLPVWDTPVVEVMIRTLVSQGLTDITLAVNHFADLIVSYFGDGQRLGARLGHLRESREMGTAGPLSLLPLWTGDMLVSNGDILTDIDIARMQAAHKRASAAITIASITRQVRSDSGVLHVDDEDNLLEIQEKPVRAERISIGIYIVNESVRRFLPQGRPLEMPTLIERCLAAGLRVIAYPHEGIWLDIGRPEDYARGQSDEAIGALIQRLMTR
ncbi:MAG: sugar phosphate nucleotidyltransferase [Azospirillaceae bacterium]